MRKTDKGRTDPEELLGRKETAALLGVCLSTLDKLVVRGVLTPRTVAGRTLRFPRAEIEQARAILEGKVDVGRVWAVATQALTAARIAEQRLEALQDLLGLNVIPLGRTEEALHETYEASLQEPSPRDLLDTRWVRYWGGVLYGIDESYFELLADYLGSDEPWRTFYDFSSRVMRARPLDEIAYSSGFRAAYVYFEAARMHLLHVSYFYCRLRLGLRAANGVFPGPNRGGLDRVMECLT